MIRVYIHEQLGNQMFQYAAALRLALHHNTSVGLDVSFFGRKRRGLQLGKFNISGQTLPAWQHIVMKKIGLRKDRSVKYSTLPRFGENHSCSGRLLDMPEECFLYGMFQSFMFFDAIADEVRKEFALKPYPVMTEEKEVERSILDCESVAVHVRRGDYLNSDNFNVCNTEYYLNAIEDIRERKSHPRFFFFSNDIEYCRHTFDFPDASFVQLAHVADGTISDFRLMQLCNHHIIANSTFSWWAAWLAGSENGTVIAPSIWFRDGSAPIAEKIPAGWETMDFRS